MDMGVKGRTALVLGGSGGLGSAVATGLAAEGVSVVVAGRDAERVQPVVDAIRSAGGTAVPAIWTLGDLAAADAAISQIEDALGGIDILVNNTGGPPPSPAGGQDAERWRQQFDAMVLSVISVTDRVLVGMRERQWGRIITSTSSGVVAPIPNLGLSNTLRRALVGWSKTLSSEVARDGITVNIVVPGRIATGRVAFLDEQKAKRVGASVEQIARQSRDAIPIGRYGDPKEYAAAIVFLASQPAAYITGATLRVDGGMIASI